MSVVLLLIVLALLVLVEAANFNGTLGDVMAELAR